MLHRPPRELAAGRGGGRRLQPATDGKPGKSEFQRYPELARGAAFWLLALRGAQRKQRKRAVYRSFPHFLAVLTDSGGPSLHFWPSEQLCCSRFHFCLFWPLNRLLSEKSREKSDLSLFPSLSGPRDGFRRPHSSLLARMAKSGQKGHFWSLSGQKPEPAGAGRVEIVTFDRIRGEKRAKARFSGFLTKAIYLKACFDESEIQTTFWPQSGQKAAF